LAASFISQNTQQVSQLPLIAGGRRVHLQTFSFDHMYNPSERQARLAINDLDRAAWLRVAQGWMSLLKKRPQSEDDSEPPK
jgi:hypothetical protein